MHALPPHSCCLQAAHELVHEGVATFQGQRAYELHAYHALCKAHVTSEKLDVLGLHLGALQKALGDATPGGTHGAARTCTAAAAAAEAAAAGAVDAGPSGTGQSGAAAEAAI